MKVKITVVTNQGSCIVQNEAEIDSLKGFREKYLAGDWVNICGGKDQITHIRVAEIQFVEVTSVPSDAGEQK